MGKLILVTGGAGFIGSHLVDLLAKKGHSVRVLDNLEPQVHGSEKPNYLNPKASYLWGDVRDPAMLAKALQGVEAVFHEAAMVGVGQSMYQVDKYCDVNVQGTARLLEFLVNKPHSVRKLVVASSMSIYGEGAYTCNDCGPVHPELRPESQLKAKEWEPKCPNCRRPVRSIPTGEQKPPHPTSVYAVTKRDQEELAISVGRAYGLPTVALRYFNVFGPRQSLSNPYTGVCAIFSSQIKAGNPPKIYEDGAQTRDFVSVSDIAAANLLVLESAKASFQAFNVGSGRPVSILQVAQTLIDLYKKPMKPTVANAFRAGDIRHCYADIGRIRKLGYEPSVSFEQGMRELVQWGQYAKSEDKTAEAHAELVQRGLVAR